MDILMVEMKVVNLVVLLAGMLACWKAVLWVDLMADPLVDLLVG